MDMDNKNNGLVYDSLTGVLSFKSFMEEAQRILDENPEKQYMILAWDIERFKVVNDIFGMTMGDKVLKDIVNTFSRQIFSDGIIGRIGGDKFICFCNRDNIDTALLSDRMKYSIETAHERYRLFIQAGLYYVEDRTIPVIKMCDRALMALNSIKGIHTDKIEVYTETKREELLTGQQLVSDMDRGITDREFFIVIQPIYDIQKGIIAAGEVLVRWKHPKYGLLMPGRFVPVFEKNYMINKLDHYVWEEACRVIREAMDNKEALVPLSINVSRANLYHDDLLKILDGLVDKYNIPKEFLRVEITESAYVDNPERLINTVNLLKKSGYTVLMDDFGTGYSSLNLLKDLSFDILKIDKKLIDEIVESDRAGNVVSSVIRMAKWLGMTVVAEGVETGKQASLLKNIGSDYIQGYYYSRPVSVDEFKEKCRHKTDDGDVRIDYEDADIDNLLNVKSPQLRAFMEEIIGPMALYEYDEVSLKLLKVNSEYTRIYKTSPLELYMSDNEHMDSHEAMTSQRLIEAVINARLNKKQQYVIISRRTEHTDWMWLGITIRYIGDREGKSRFIFSIKDVTKEQKRYNKKILADFYPLLCHIYREIIELNYVDGTLTTLYKDDNRISSSYKKAPMRKLFDAYVENVLEEESRAEFTRVTSAENMDKFFKSNDKLFTFQFKGHLAGGETYSCETTFIKNSDNPEQKSVIACTRVLK